ncbi:MAG: hypothetical protein Q8L89_04085 [Gammaproteobacteria bacterium]|nr:hypothetical protein [Gammaproteobacteria bacterium]
MSIPYCEMSLRSSLRPLTRAVLTLLTAAWLMLALQPCAMAMSAMDDCEQCPPSEAGLTAQTGCVSSASCVARQDWQQTAPVGITPLTPALPSTLAWYEALPVVTSAAVFPPPDYILPPPFQRFDRLHI